MPRLVIFLAPVILASCATTPEPRLRVEPGQILRYDCTHVTKSEYVGPGRQTGSSKQAFPYHLSLTVKAVSDGGAQLTGTALDADKMPTGETFDWAIDEQGRWLKTRGLRHRVLGYCFGEENLDGSADRTWRVRWLSLLDLAPVGEFAEGGRRELELLSMGAQAKVVVDWYVESADEAGWTLMSTGEVAGWRDPVNETTLVSDRVSGRARISARDGLPEKIELRVEVQLADEYGDVATSRTLDVTLERVQSNRI